LRCIYRQRPLWRPSSSRRRAAQYWLRPRPFIEIEISSGISAIVTVGGAQSVVAESPRQEELEELIIEVSGGKLRAYRDWNLLDLFDWGPGDRPTTITISVRKLTAANANSGADVEVTGMSGDAIRLNSSSGADLTAKAVSGRSFDLNASSGADLTVDGSCERAEVNASSGSDLRAEKLLCESVDANASSGASADVHASASLKANASSGGNIDVYGKPATVDQETSSGGDIELRD
jgi:hypothetical protein